MYNDHTPDAFARTSPTPVATKGHTMKIIARRARIEHMAVELLRLGNVLRLPVPVEEIYLSPPLQLWQINAPRWPTLSSDPEEKFAQRLELARSIARLVGESGWTTRIRLMGRKPLTPDDVETFAATLLVPTALLSALNARQRSPQTVAALFQVPLEAAIRRLAELGYLPHEASEPPTDPPPVF